jgi:hypothetical protein
VTAVTTVKTAVTAVTTAKRSVPLDLSSSDTVERISSLGNSGPLLPDTSIVSLDGAINLGAILFTFVIYNGLGNFRPADLCLPLFATVANQREDQWFKDFSEGFQHNVPPLVELLRVVFFAGLGWGFNLGWIAVLDGDSFWGWSTAATLVIPSGLINMARPEKLTREQQGFDNKMRSDFSTFAPTILSQEKDAKCSETNIILRFRRNYTLYRTEEEVSDKVLKKMVRQWIGFKANSEGYYMGMSLLNRKKESRIALAKTMRRLDKEKEAMLLERENDDDNEDDEPKFENEFIRDNKTVRK